MNTPARPVVPPPRPSWKVGLLLAAGSIVFTLLLVEGALRLAGFEYHVMPAVQFGWPDPQTIQSSYAPDSDLFWVTKDYRQKLAMARRTHPDVIFMGDSCTEFGRYPILTMERLSHADGPFKTGIHLAAGGWTSEQGLAQMQRDVVPLHPKVVVIFYGWNDHWMALGPTDSELHQLHRYLPLEAHSRLVELALKSLIAAAQRRHEQANRVSPARYRSNLEAMARLARQAGSTPVFVTAPSNHVAGHEPEYLLRRHVQRLADVIPLHQQYIGLTREAAEHSGAFLCDAADEFASMPGSHDQFFKADAIHFTAEGDQQLARIVSSCIIQATSSRPRLSAESVVIAAYANGSPRE